MLIQCTKFKKNFVLKHKESSKRLQIHVDLWKVPRDLVQNLRSQGTPNEVAWSGALAEVVHELTSTGRARPKVVIARRLAANRAAWRLRSSYVPSLWNALPSSLFEAPDRKILEEFQDWLFFFFLFSSLFCKKLVVCCSQLGHFGRSGCAFNSDQQRKLRKQCLLLVDLFQRRLLFFVAPSHEKFQSEVEQSSNITHWRDSTPHPPSSAATQQVVDLTEPICKSTAPI